MDEVGQVGSECFSADYFTARTRFREAALRAGARVDSLKIGATGPNSEDLTIDIAWFGAEMPQRVFVHSSGLHGVEGFAGSAIQLQWLQQGYPPLTENTAIVMVHILNPYGMAWLRRFNENNVDLNRNFLGPTEQYAGAPGGYDNLDGFLNPGTPPSADFFYARAAWLLTHYKLSTLRQAVAGGQYVNSKGLFFGGARLEEGPRKFEAYMADRLTMVERLVAVDVHTGLGTFGDDRLLVLAAPQTPAFHAMQRAYGERIQPLDPDQSVAYRVRGSQHEMYARLVPNRELYFAAQEFGTYNSLAVLAALRAENRWHHYGSGTVDHPAKRRLGEVFGPRSDRWRRAILRRGGEVIGQAMALACDKNGAGRVT